MKKTLLNILCGLLLVALLGGALCIGAVRGWRGERESALTALSSNYSALLEERAMDAANLLVVASRHLDPADERIELLKQARTILANPPANAEAVVQADVSLSALAAELGQSLPQLASVQASARDQAYVSTLTRTLGEESTLAESYQTIAEEFNNRLTSSASGWVARLFGVSPIDGK